MTASAGKTMEAATLVFRPDSGDLFTMNATGELVWRLYTQGYRADEIARRLAKNHGVLLDEARIDVFAFLASARRYGLEIA